MLDLLPSASDLGRQNVPVSSLATGSPLEATMWPSGLR